MAALWSQLPSDLVEKVLCFVPVPDLCRYRSVCRKWNQLICNPAFATLHAQNGKRRGASFLAMEMRVPIKDLTELTWCLLDLNARRWYIFRDDIVARRRNNSLGFGPRQQPELITMDGGLVCRISRKKSPMLSIFVHDLFGHTVKSLPLIRRHLTRRMLPKAHMVVDSTTHHFTIFLLNRGFGLEYTIRRRIPPEEMLKIIGDPLMHIYDSAVDEWRSASNPQELVFTNVVSVVMCQGLLYALVSKLEQVKQYTLEYMAICYNPAEDAWKCSEICLSEHDTEYPQLIATPTRLFVASWKWKVNYEFREGSYNSNYEFEVSEIVIPQMTPKTLFKLPIPDVVELLEIKNIAYADGPTKMEVNVIGVDNALLMHSRLSGKVKVFDLDSRSWDHGIPEHPKGRQWSWPNCLNKFAKQTDLLLPNSLQYLI